MKESSILITLYLSLMLSLCFMNIGVYNEIAYLKSTLLINVIPSQENLLHTLILVITVLFISVTLSLALQGRKRLFAMIANFGVLILFQIIMFFYGVIVINSSSSKYEHYWENLENTDKLIDVEKTLKCCGYVDPIMSASKKCTYNVACRDQIEAEKPYRMLRFMAYTMLAILLQVLNIASLSFLKSEHKQNNEFDELLIST